jgi:LmbE family N-acetylglucosaminyl deacetylase
MQSLNIESDFVPYQATETVPQGNVLVLAPHPDDEVFGCGGAIMQHTAQQDSVFVVLVTDGQAAESHDDISTQQDYVQMRLAESRAAADILGYQHLIQWQYTDRRLQCDDALIQRISDLVEHHQIQRIYAPSVQEIHPDHYALGLAAYHAVQNSQSEQLKLVMYEVGVPLNPNILLNISSLKNRKNAAMACFTSQLKLRNYGLLIDSLNQYRAYTLPAHVTHAEAYYEISGQALHQEPELRFGLTRQSAELQRANVEIHHLKLNP